MRNTFPRRLLVEVQKEVQISSLSLVMFSLVFWQTQCTVAFRFCKVLRWTQVDTRFSHNQTQKTFADRTFEVEVFLLL